MKGMGLGIGPSKAVEDAEESVEEVAMKAFSKALKSGDSAAQLDAFRELLTCCGESDDSDD